jgi:hypothetical protein
MSTEVAFCMMSAGTNKQGMSIASATSGSTASTSTDNCRPSSAKMDRRNLSNTGGCLHRSLLGAMIGVDGVYQSIISRGKWVDAGPCSDY